MLKLPSTAFLKAEPIETTIPSMLDEGQHSLETSAEVEYLVYFRHNVTVNFDFIHFSYLCLVCIFV